jgi:hypothetical protein
VGVWNKADATATILGQSDGIWKIPPSDTIPWKLNAHLNEASYNYDESTSTLTYYTNRFPINSFANAVKIGLRQNDNYSPSKPIDLTRTLIDLSFVGGMVSAAARSIDNTIYLSLQDANNTLMVDFIADWILVADATTTTETTTTLTTTEATTTLTTQETTLTTDGTTTTTTRSQEPIGSTLPPLVNTTTTTTQNPNATTTTQNPNTTTTTRTTTTTTTTSPDNIFICFKEGTRILTNTGYVRVETLVEGHLIQTFRHGLVPLRSLRRARVFNTGGSAPRSRNRLYVYRRGCEGDGTPFADLVVTGEHSALVPVLPAAQKAAMTRHFGYAKTTDSQYHLLAQHDPRAVPYEPQGVFTVYHFALECGRNYERNYGVFANGMLMESCSVNHLSALLMY